MSLLLASRALDRGDVAGAVRLLLVDVAALRRARLAAAEVSGARCPLHPAEHLDDFGGCRRCDAEAPADPADGVPF